MNNEVASVFGSKPIGVPPRGPPPRGAPPRGPPPRGLPPQRPPPIRSSKYSKSPLMPGNGPSAPEIMRGMRPQMPKKPGGPFRAENPSHQAQTPQSLGRVTAPPRFGPHIPADTGGLVISDGRNHPALQQQLHQTLSPAKFPSMEIHKDSVLSDARLTQPSLSSKDGTVGQVPTMRDGSKYPFGKMTITFLKGLNLKAGQGIFGRADPYLKVRLGHQVHTTQPHLSGGKNPVRLPVLNHSVFN